MFVGIQPVLVAALVGALLGGVIGLLIGPFALLAIGIMKPGPGPEVDYD